MRGTVSSAGSEVCGRSILSRAQWRAIGEALQLSARELHTVQYFFDGAEEASIGLEMGISVNTVHTHAKRLYCKLGVRNRSELLVRIFAAHMSLSSRPASHRTASPHGGT